jgi:hypothetical protein
VSLHDKKGLGKKKKKKGDDVTRFWYTLKNLDLIKCKTCHGKSEKKSEFGNPRSESLGFKCGTPIMLGPWGTYLKPNMANTSIGTNNPSC